MKVIKKKKIDTRKPELLETEIGEAERKLKEITDRMSQPEIARDATELVKLDEEYRQTEEQLAILYDEWDKAAATQG